MIHARRGCSVRAWIGVLLTGAIVACVGGDGGGGGGGVNEDNFGQKFEDKYCEEYEACAGTTSCLLTTGATPTGYTPPTTGECDFDQQAADDCIDGEWDCIAMGAYSFVLPPPACCAVCGDPPCDVPTL